MSIKSQCNELRQALQEYCKIQTQKQEQEIRNHESNLLQKARSFTFKLYKELEDRIYASYGRAINLPVRLYDCYEADHPIVLQEIERLCGLILTPVPNEKERFTIQSTEHLKICKIGNKTLDFPQLFREDHNRDVYWSTHLDEIAKAWIDKCITRLEATPNRFYGIPDRITILEDGRTAFSGCWQFSNLKLDYGQLDQEHIDELTTAINHKISHGRIEISHPDRYLSSMWVYFHKVPDKVIEDAYYDYATFYERFEQVTPALQAIFDNIALNVELFSPEQQILALQSQHKLVYMFDCDQKQIWQDLHDHVAHTERETALIQTVENTHPGIKITRCNFLNRSESWCSPRGCAHGVRTYDERIEFDFEVSALWGKLTFEDRRLDLTIDQLRLSVHSAIARVLAEKIISQIRRTVHGKTPLSILGKNRLYDEKDQVFDDLIFTVGDYQIDLKKVNNSEFLDRINQEIIRLSDGFISIATREESYILVFIVHA